MGVEEKRGEGAPKKSMPLGAKNPCAATVKNIYFGIKI